MTEADHKGAERTRRRLSNASPHCLSQMIREAHDGIVHNREGWCPEKKEFATRGFITVDSRSTKFLEQLQQGEDLSDGLWLHLRRLCKEADVFERDAEWLIGQSLEALVQAEVWAARPLKSRAQLLVNTTKLATLARQLENAVSKHHELRAIRGTYFWTDEEGESVFEQLGLWLPEQAAGVLSELSPVFPVLIQSNGPSVRETLRRLRLHAEGMVRNYRSCPAPKARAKNATATYFLHEMCRRLNAYFEADPIRPLAVIGATLAQSAFEQQPGADPVAAAEKYLQRLRKRGDITA